MLIMKINLYQMIFSSFLLEVKSTYFAYNTEDEQTDNEPISDKQKKDLYVMILGMLVFDVRLSFSRT